MAYQSDDGVAGRGIPADSDAPQEHTRKRKRIPIACNACRTRKSRCDGTRPQCHGCVALHIDCVYTAQLLPSTTAVSSSIHALEARLSTVEGELRALKHAHASASSSSVALNSVRHASPHMDLGDETAVEESPGVTDGVGTVEFSAEQSAAYFGPSSNISFTRLLRGAIVSKYQSLESSSGSSVRSGTLNPSQNRDRLLMSRPQSPTHISSPLKSWPSAFAPKRVRLPPVNDVTVLVKRFFSDTAMLFPYIHERTFWETFDQAKRDCFKTVRAAWLGLLNMILAMATSTSMTGNAIVNADSFFANAEHLCLKATTTDATVESVQVMLLMVQYLQGTQRSIQTWAVHGRAIGAAIQLGLHANDALETLSPLEREIRVRTWYCCVALDRVLSLTFGRPPAISEAHVLLRLPRHVITRATEDLPYSEWSTEENSTFFWNGTIALYKIMNNIIDLLYGLNLGSGTLPSIADMAASSLSIEQQLKFWKSSLPNSITLITGADLQPMDCSSLSIKLRLVLTLRYHNTRILAHRAILDRHLKLLSGHIIDADEVAAVAEFGTWSRNFCLQSAEAIIDLVWSALRAQDRQHEFLGAWWFTLYYVFNAGLVVAATVISDGPKREGQEQFDNVSTSPMPLLDRVVSCLPHIESNGHMPAKCARFIAVLKQQIVTLGESAIVESGMPGTGSVVGNGADWQALDPAMLPELDPNFTDAGMDEFSHFIALSHLDEIGPGDLLW